MDFEQRGMWFELLLFMRECEEYGKLVHDGKPMPVEMIARGIGVHIDEPDLLRQNARQTPGKTFGKFLNLLEQLGALKRDPDTGVLFSSRLLRDAKLTQVRSAAGKKGAKITNSSNGFAAAKLAANGPAKARQNRVNDSGSSSFSSSVPTKNEEPVTPPHEQTQERKNALRSLWADFATFWASYPKRADDSEQGAKNAWYQAIFDDGATAEAIIIGAKHYKSYICESKRKEKIVYSAGRFIREKIYDQFKARVEPEQQEAPEGAYERWKRRQEARNAKQ